MRRWTPADVKLHIQNAPLEEHDGHKGRQLTLSRLQVGIVGTKYHLDLRERDLAELADGRRESHQAS